MSTCDLPLWRVWEGLRLLSPASTALVGSHKSSLGLAHDWGRPRFAAEPQPNSSNSARSRPVCSPEPRAAGGEGAGRLASASASASSPATVTPSHLVALYRYALTLGDL